MDYIREKWNQPWHALQRNLAQGVHAEVAADYAVSLQGAKEQRQGAKGQTVTLAASSWLGRSRHRTESPPTR
jgi:hypothetical protein